MLRPAFVALTVAASFACVALSGTGAAGPAAGPPASAPGAVPTSPVTGPATARSVSGPGHLRTITLPVRDLGTGRSRDVIVYTPDVADPNSLPVLYLLHGLPGTASDLCSPGLAAGLDAAFRRGARPFEVACPDGSATVLSDSEWADSADGTTTLETFVTGEVRVAVEGAHPRLASMRAIGGFSMGGFGAAALGLRHPDLYGSVVSLAGYFHLDDPDHVFGTSGPRQQDHDPSRLVAAARGQCWYLAEAAGDGSSLTGRAAEQFAGSVRAAGAVVALRRTPGDHSPTWAVAQLADVAGFLGRCWGAP